MAGNGDIDFQVDGTWTGGNVDVVGDPMGVGPGTSFSLADYLQSNETYVGTPTDSTLFMGNGNSAFILDESGIPGGGAGPMAQNITEIKLGSGNQLVDLCSTQYSLNVQTIVGGSGNDVILNSDGNTTIHTGSGNTYVWTGNGNDTVICGRGADTIACGIGADIVTGGTGNDYVYAGEGNQSLTGGSGVDTLDFSRLDGYLNIDQCDHVATFTDAVTGAIYNYSVTSFDTVITTNEGCRVEGEHDTSHTYYLGAGTNLYHSESGGDTITTAAGSINTFHWDKLYVLGTNVDNDQPGKMDTITDFNIGVDTLDMSDFLKGQTNSVTGQLMTNLSYNQVVRLEDYVEANGQHDTIVQAMVYNSNTWDNVVLLQGVDMFTAGPNHQALTLSNLGMLATSHT